jgi:hypothetical protein
MRGYFVAAQLSQAAALELRWAHGPPAVAGEIFARPPLPPNVAGSEALDEAEAADEVGEASRPDGGAEVAACGAAAAAEADYPEGGYWAVPPAVRVSMLHALVHDALECEELRWAGAAPSRSLAAQLLCACTASAAANAPGDQQGRNAAGSSRAVPSFSHLSTSCICLPSVPPAPSAVIQPSTPH